MSVWNTSKHGFLGQLTIRSLGQEITDPQVLARVNLAEAFGKAIKVVWQVAQVPPEVMTNNVFAAKATFGTLLMNPAYVNYVMKVLVLAAVIVKKDIRALMYTPEQLAIILAGADEAVREAFPKDQIEEKLKAQSDDVIAQAPESIKEEVKKLLDTSGISSANLAPNMPEGLERPLLNPEAEGLSGLEKAALVGIPVAILVAVGALWKRRKSSKKALPRRV